MASNDELLDALAFALQNGEALLAAEEARYLFVRDADPELLIVERATKEPEFDIWSARYDQRGLEEALTARRLAIGHFGGTAYLFNENGETFDLTSLDVKVDTTTFFERLDEVPDELLNFVGTEVADVARRKETSPGR